MRLERTDSFKSDWKRLSASERALFGQALHKFVVALDSREGRRALNVPRALRVKPVRGARGIYEFTWSFSGPDGRATFEYRTMDGEQTLLLRRVGGHRVFRST